MGSASRGRTSLVRPSGSLLRSTATHAVHLALLVLLSGAQLPGTDNQLSLAPSRGPTLPLQTSLWLPWISFHILNPDSSDQASTKNLPTPLGTLAPWSCCQRDVYEHVYGPDSVPSTLMDYLF